MIFKEVNLFWSMVSGGIAGGLVLGLMVIVSDLMDNFINRNYLQVKSFDRVLRKNDVVKVEAIVEDRICVCSLLNSHEKIAVFYAGSHGLQVGKIYKLVKLASNTTQDLSFELVS